MKNFYLFLITIFATSLGFGQTVFINEIHYDDNSGDSGEGVEIAGPAGTDLSTYTITAYNGSNGALYDTEILTGIIPDQSGNGFGTIFFPIAGLQNGAPDGIALDNNGTLIQFLSYEGSLTAIGGVANGVTSTDIGVSESGSVEGESLQLIGSGTIYTDFSWSISMASTYDAINTGQTFSAPSSDTSVQFASSSISVLEDVGTIDLTFEITNEDATNSTSFDVVLTTGDAADINGYTTQTVTFSAGSSTNETVTITISDDALVESNETLTFEIQSVSGGNNAVVGTNNTFDLTIQDNDGTTPLPGDIVITEIMYNSSGTDDEWIEIYNASGADITLDSSWRLNYNGNTYDFTGVLISDESYLTIAVGSSGDTIFNNDNPFTPDVSTIGIPAADINNTNNLINSSATIELIYDPSGINSTIDTVTYDDGSPWPTTPDGNGPSLELTDTSLDNALASSWTASYNNGGSPGSATPIVYTFNATWSPSDPNTNATANDVIVVDSGDAIINSNTTCNSVTVNPGASLTINTGVTLDVTNGTTLESSSTSYSSLILDGSITGSVSYKRYVNAYTNDAVNNDNDLISAPVTGQAFGSFDSANTNLLASGSVRAFAPFNNNTDVYENYDATTNVATTLDAATGYRAATTDGATLTFTGTVNTGDVLKNITIGTGASYAEWNLIGNPYPSYIDVEAFLTHVVSTQTSGERNIDLLDALSGIYGYDGDASDGWDIITLANDAGRYLAPGQGFFVAASGNGTLIADHDIEFTAAMRTTGTSDDFIAGRNNNPLTFIELKAFTANNDYSTEFYFDADASQGLDPGYDAVIWGGSAPSFALYSHLVQDNTGLPIALQALSDTDYNNVIIPLGVNANMSEQLTFSIVENTLPASIEVYLDDTLTSTSTLLNASDYVLTPSEDLNGTGRFYLRFSNSALSITNAIFEGVSIYTHQSNKTLTIAGQLTEGTSAYVYDIQGRVVASKALASNTTLQTVDVSNLNTGVYIVKLANGNTVKTQKIILK